MNIKLNTEADKANNLTYLNVVLDFLEEVDYKFPKESIAKIRVILNDVDDTSNLLTFIAFALASDRGMFIRMTEATGMIISTSGPREVRKRFEKREK